MHFFRPQALLAALVLLLPLLLFSCAKNSSKKTGSQLKVPVTEETQEERLQIETTLTEIERIAADLGRPQSFRAIPVVVTTEDTQETRRHAACFMENGKGVYISVNRRVLEVESVIGGLGVESTLFRVLLHEIGHCFFARDHLNDQITQPGYTIEWKRGGERHPQVVEFNFFNVSSMEAHTLTMPVVLKRYYVAEILGLERAAQLDDLQSYAPFTFVINRR